MDKVNALFKDVETNEIETCLRRTVWRHLKTSDALLHQAAIQRSISVFLTSVWAAVRVSTTACCRHL